MNDFNNISSKVQLQKFNKQKKTFFHSCFGQINVIRPATAIALNDSCFASF